MNTTIADNLMELFAELDDDESGTITQEEFTMFLGDTRVAGYMDALKIDTSDAARLFKLLDSDGSDQILIEEFIEGCMKLQGQAKSMDLHSLIYETRRMETKIDRLLRTVLWLFDTREYPSEGVGS